MTAALTRPRRRVGDLTPRIVNPDDDARSQEAQVRLEEIAFLRSFGMPWNRVAERLGEKENTVRKAVERARERGIVIE